MRAIKARRLNELLDKGLEEIFKYADLFKRSININPLNLYNYLIGTKPSIQCPRVAELFPTVVKLTKSG